MNKIELVKAVVGKTGIQKGDAEQVVNAVFETIVETLAKGESVEIFKFAKFEVVPTAARVGRNPQTGAEVPIPAGKKIKIKQLKDLKDATKA